MYVDVSAGRQQDSVIHFPASPRHSNIKSDSTLQDVKKCIEPSPHRAVTRFRQPGPPAPPPMHGRALGPRQVRGLRRDVNPDGWGASDRRPAGTGGRRARGGGGEFFKGVKCVTLFFGFRSERTDSIILTLASHAQ